MSSFTNGLVAAAGNSGEKVYVEDVFSTYLYTGTGSTQSIVNDIDLSTKGGLVWVKSRNATQDNVLTDTVRGVYYPLFSNLTSASTFAAEFISSFDATGFTPRDIGDLNISGRTYASWTFRKQAKFFDVVTYTGNGVAGRTVAHNLGSAPGMIIVKCTSQSTNWLVYHRSTTATKGMLLDSTSVGYTSSAYWNDTEPTSSVFSLGTSAAVNETGHTYVAYLFADDAGGFGDSGTDSVVACGSFTTDSNGSGSATIGWEPQFLLMKASSTTGNWFIYDPMRGFSLSDSKALYANLSNAEATYGSASYPLNPTATGFSASNILAGNQTYIYLAIRRGPMKTPTDATKVFSQETFTPSGNGEVKTFTPGFALDTAFIKSRDTWGASWFYDKIRGVDKYLNTSDINTEGTGSSFGVPQTFSSTTLTINSTPANRPHMTYMLRRAAGFFDIVCYKGTGSNTTVSHNLGVAPEMMIIKKRNEASATGWAVYGPSFNETGQIFLNSTGGYGLSGSAFWNSTKPTSSVFSLGTYEDVNKSSINYVAYLFATCPGVSKVGSYTGTATTKQIDCGFTNGARFVMIKRTDTTGDWYVWDSARGIVSGNDPYLLINSTAAETTNTDYIDPYSAGFELSSTAPDAVNANGGTYIFLAIA